MHAQNPKHQSNGRILASLPVREPANRRQNAGIAGSSALSVWSRRWWRFANSPVSGCLACLLVAVSAGCSRSSRQPLAPVTFAPGDEVHYVPVATRVVALTFDDGPDVPYTDALLSVLADHKVKATFFLVGRNVDAHPDAAKRIVDAGHEVGNHTYSHPRLDKGESEIVADEIDRAEAAIAKATGQKPRLFRSSFGHVPEGLPALSRDHGYLMVGWSSDGNDWNYRHAEAIAARVIDRLHPGQIILLHDGHNADEGYDQSRVVAATHLILQHLEAEGYEAVTVSELLRRYQPSPDEIQFPGGMRYMGMNLIPDTLSAGGDLRAAYYWYFTADAARAPCVAAIHFAGADGVALQNDHAVEMRHLRTVENTIIVAPGVPPGPLEVRVALCPAENTSRLGRMLPQTARPVHRHMVTTSSILTVTDAGKPL